MRQRPAIHWVFWAAVIALSMNAIRLAVTTPGRVADGATDEAAPPGAFRPVPHTVTLKSVFRRTDGSIVPSFTETEAVRADGSRVHRQEGVGAAAHFVLRRINFATGQRVEVDDVLERKSTEWGRYDWSEVRDPQADCRQSVLGQPQGSGLQWSGEDRVLGFRATVFKGSRVTIWYSRDLGCQKVKARSAPTAFGYSSKEPVSIIVGEPDSLLFEVPTHYREVPPSTFHGLDVHSPDGRAVDQVYLRHQPARPR